VCGVILGSVECSFEKCCFLSSLVSIGIDYLCSSVFVGFVVSICCAMVVVLWLWCVGMYFGWSVCP